MLIYECKSGTASVLSYSTKKNFLRHYVCVRLTSFLCYHISMIRTFVEKLNELIQWSKKWHFFHMFFMGTMLLAILVYVYLIFHCFSYGKIEYFWLILFSLFHFTCNFFYSGLMILFPVILILFIRKVCKKDLCVSGGFLLNNKRYNLLYDISFYHVLLFAPMLFILLFFNQTYSFLNDLKRFSLTHLWLVGMIIIMPVSFGLLKWGLSIYDIHLWESFIISVSIVFSALLITISVLIIFKIKKIAHANMHVHSRFLLENKIYNFIFYSVICMLIISIIIIFITITFLPAWFIYCWFLQGDEFFSGFSY